MWFGRCGNGEAVGESGGDLGVELVGVAARARVCILARREMRQSCILDSKAGTLLET